MIQKSWKILNILLENIEFYSSRSWFKILENAGFGSWSRDTVKKFNPVMASQDDPHRNKRLDPRFRRTDKNRRKIIESRIIFWKIAPPPWTHTGYSSAGRLDLCDTRIWAALAVLHYIHTFDPLIHIKFHIVHSEKFNISYTIAHTFQIRCNSVEDPNPIRIQSPAFLEKIYCWNNSFNFFLSKKASTLLKPFKVKTCKPSNLQNRF